MPCRLLIKNLANNYSTGDVICVCEGDHIFGKYESKIQFDNAGLVGWAREFVIVNVPDADIEYYQYLLENNEETSSRRYYLAQQTEESPFYQDLLDYAEVTAPKIAVDSLVIDRSA